MICIFIICTPNHEIGTVVIRETADILYLRHSDEVQITTSDSDGQNILGMEEFQFLPYYCGRSIKTFTKGPTAFIANIDGPVR